MSRLKDNNYKSQDIVGIISIDLSLPKSTTDLVVSSFFKNILKIVKEDGRVKIDGFGTFEPFKRNSKKKPPSNTLRFMPSVVCEKELNIPKNVKGEV